MSERHFFIAATPRSRTAWLATFLDSYAVSCQHEGLARVKTMDDFQVRLEEAPQPVSGECGTLGPILYPALVRRFPQARWALVHRAVAEVASDFAALKVPHPQLAAADCERRFQIMREAMPNAPVAEYHDLGRESVIRDLWDYATWGEPFPADRYARMCELQIQIAPWLFLDLLYRRTPTVQELIAAELEGQP